MHLLLRKLKEYIKNEYKEDYDYTLENTQVENGKKYYQIRVRTTYKIEGALDQDLLEYSKYSKMVQLLNCTN